MNRGIVLAVVFYLLGAVSMLFICSAFYIDAKAEHVEELRIVQEQLDRSEESLRWSRLGYSDVVTMDRPDGGKDCWATKFGETDMKQVKCWDD